MLASRLLKVTRFFPAARSSRREPPPFSLPYLALARCAAAAICLWRLDAAAFAQEGDVGASPPKIQTAKEVQKKARKTPVDQKAQSEAPASANQPASSSPHAADGRGAVQSPPRALRDEKVGKAPLAKLPPPDTATPPPRLPDASREKMRACAIEWSKLKLEARNPLPLWRDFGAKCLTR